jgi:hypothetical protein
MSDQKKCGLTFPLEILETIYLQAHEIFPDAGFDLIKGYSNGYIKIHEKRWPITGGPGLGQLSNAISIAVSIMFIMFQEDHDEYNLEGRFYIDDQTIKLRLDLPFRPNEDIYSEEIFDLFKAWDDEMEQFGLKIHKKKPYASYGAIMLEVPGDDYPITYNKVSQWVCSVFHTLVQANIALAKDYFSSVYNTLYESDRLHAIQILHKVIIPFWGYEFFPEEFNLPYQLGGWIRSVDERGNNDLFYHLWKIPSNMGGLPLLPTIQVEWEIDKAKLGHHKKLRLQTLEKAIKSSSSDMPPTLDYFQIMGGALKSSRLRVKTKLKTFQTYLKRRQKILQSKHFESNIKKLAYNFMDLLVTGDRIVVPTIGILQEIKLIDFLMVDFLEVTDNSSKFDVRSWFLIQQEQGTLTRNGLRFRDPTPVGLLERLWYNVITGVFPYKNSYITPRQLNAVLWYGINKIEDFTYYTLKYIDKFGILEPKYLIKEIIQYFTESCLDNIIYLDHEIKMAFKTNILPETGLDDLQIHTSISTFLLEPVRKYVLSYQGEICPVPYLLNWNDLRDYFKPFVDICHSTYKNRPPAKPPPIEDSDIDNESQRLYLISLVMASARRADEIHVVNQLPLAEENTAFLSAQAFLDARVIDEDNLNTGLFSQDDGDY